MKRRKLILSPHQRKPSVYKRIFSIDRHDILSAFLGVLIFLMAIPTITYIYFAKDLTTKEHLMNRNNTGVVLFDRHNTPFFTFFEAKNKTFVPLDKIPLHLQQALIANEDKDFYNHPGFSIKAILRSLIANIQNKDLRYGGSTITQQLIKNSLLNPQRNFLRKYQEIVLAYEVERRFSKSEILEMYLNSVYFGEGAFGVEEAAQTYFDKPVSDLTLAESALMVGLLPSPSTLSPLSNGIDEAQNRQKIVLEKMREQEYISQPEKEQSESEELTLNDQKRPLNSQAVHFALMAKEELIQKYGEEYVSRSGFKVRTAIDLNWQRLAEEAVDSQVNKLAANHVTNGAAVVLDVKTGEIKALVGSVDWHNPDFGRVNVTLMPRQPGSSFKPIFYSAALEQGIITTNTILKDQPTTFPGEYKPKDYDGRFRGPVTARRALANSLNVPAVEVISKIGVPAALEMAKRLGISTLKEPDNYGLSLALGAGEVKLLELTGAYATFANSGQMNTPTTIIEIKDKEDQTIYTSSPNPKLVLNPGVAFLISSILSDSFARAEMFGNALTISRPAAVKTGTTEDYRDSLTIGYTPSLAIGVWVGNNDGSFMDNVAGSLGAAPIWQSLMEQFLKDTEVEQFIPPEAIVAEFTCRSPTSSYKEYFLKGTEPKDFCPTPLPPVTNTPSPAATPN